MTISVPQGTKEPSNSHGVLAGVFGKSDGSPHNYLRVFLSIRLVAIFVCVMLFNLFIKLPVWSSWAMDYPPINGEDLTFFFLTKLQ